jgi:biotin transport system ATP-binding protein
VRPSVILADEPTSALDLVNRAQVIREILGIPARLVVATHDLDLARTCDRALWIHSGRVAADGAPDQVVGAYIDAAEGRSPWPGETPPTHVIGNQ